MRSRKEEFTFILVAIVGCVITFSLNQGVIKINGQSFHLPFALGAVVASGLIGLIGGFIFKDHAAVNHSASFAGMSALIAIATTEQAIMVGLFVGIVYLLLEKMFGGVGGKLGTIGMLSTLIVATVMQVSHPYYSYCNFTAWATITPTLIIASIVTGALGSAVTLAVREKVILRSALYSTNMKKYNANNAVIGSALVGLVGGLLLPHIPIVGSTLSLVLYEGSFVGMTSRKRLLGYPAFLIAGAMAGALFVILYGLFPGCGGKLGFMAFTSVLAYQYGISKLLPSKKGTILTLKVAEE